MARGRLEARVKKKRDERRRQRLSERQRRELVGRVTRYLNLAFYCTLEQSQSQHTPILSRMRLEIRQGDVRCRCDSDDASGKYHVNPGGGLKPSFQTNELPRERLG